MSDNHTTDGPRGEFRLFLTDATTGERREVAQEAMWSPGEDDATEFLWTQGNFSCDCNRALFFARAAGEPDPDRDCGDEQFLLTVHSPTGEIIYDETSAT